MDEDLLCPICSGVLEEPVQVGVCFNDLTLHCVFTIIIILLLVY